MNMIVSIGAFARAAPLAGHDRPHTHTQPLPVPGLAERHASRNPLRARWSIDPGSGRLQCEWVSEGEGPDSRGFRLRRSLIHGFDCSPVGPPAA